MATNSRRWIAVLDVDEVSKNLHVYLHILNVSVKGLASLMPGQQVR
jgi:hypothetical protein